MIERMLAKEEFIGRNVSIIKCTDPSWIGREGIITDETKNTFTLKINEEYKIIGKKNSEFKFEIKGNDVILNGTKINFKPEDRIKKTG